jgi:hypothetical protein
MIAQPTRQLLVRPRGWVYAVACLPGLLGVAAAVVLATGAVNDAGSLIERIVTSPTELSTTGSITIRAAHGDGRTIYERVAHAGDGLSAASLDIRCTVRAPDGTELRVSRASGVSLEQNGANYRSLLRFDTPLDGSYVVGCRQPGRPASLTPLAIGPPLRITSILSTIGRLVGALFAFLLGIGIAGGLCVLIHERRKKSHQRLIDEPVDAITGMRP